MVVLSQGTALMRIPYIFASSNQRRHPAHPLGVFSVCVAQNGTGPWRSSISSLWLLVTSHLCPRAVTLGRALDPPCGSLLVAVTREQSGASKRPAMFTLLQLREHPWEDRCCEQKVSVGVMLQILIVGFTNGMNIKFNV